MPSDYFYQGPPPEHHLISDYPTMSEPWVANSLKPTSLDSIHHSSLENGSTHFANHQSYIFDDSLEDYQPPPPLTRDPGSPASSLWSLPPTAEQSVVHRAGPHGTYSLSDPDRSCDAIDHFDSVWQYANGKQDNVVLRKRSHGMLDIPLGNYRPRSPLVPLARSPSQDAETGQRSFQKPFGAVHEKARARSCEGQRGRARFYEYNGIEKAQWDMSRLVGFATSTCVEDWEGIKTICDKANRSDSDAKDACKALRRDIKFGLPTTQLSASKLWAILMRECTSYFVAHTTNRKFLGVIEDVALSPMTAPVVRDRIVEVVGTSVYLLRDSRNIKSYQSTWKKLRLQLKLIYPPEGFQIPVEDPFWILDPPDPLVKSESVVEEEASVSGEENTVHHLFEDCKAVLNDCRILNDTLSNTAPGNITSDPHIQVLRAKCLEFQDIIRPRIDWAMELEDRAHSRRVIFSGSSKITGTTIEGQLLNVLLNTNEEIDEVLKKYEELVKIGENVREDTDTIPVPELGEPFTLDSSVITGAPSFASLTTVSNTPTTNQEHPATHEISISKNMTAGEIVSHLVAHGCRDLSSELDLSSFDEYPTSHGGLSDVYAGQLLNGTSIAVKALRVSTTTMKQDPTHLKNAARELHTWGKCGHPNVIHLLGLALFRGRIGMISLWMKHGSLSSYLESVPGVDRFDMCIQIGEALSYLHRIGIVHGDLKGANVLVSEGGVPVLTDFGNSLLADRTLRFTQTTNSRSFTIRWSAPEIIEESTSHTEASDVYALGMTIYETLTGKVPYHGKSESNVIRLVTVKQEFPERLEFILNEGRNAGDLWKLLVRCWSYEPALRPSAVEATKNMKEMPLLNKPAIATSSSRCSLDGPQSDKRIATRRLI